MNSRTFDPVWDEKYDAGHAQRYPWDCVVTFVFRYAPKDRPRDSVRILEVGCGTASNLWFAAREGFAVAGVDGSASAIAYAQRRFAEEGLSGDLRKADFTSLPFGDGSFDMVIDRGALTCCDFDACRLALRELHRVTRPGARFFFNPYSDRHSSFSTGRPAGNGLIESISGGTLVGAGQICFYGRQDIDRALERRWDIVSLEHLELARLGVAEQSIHAEWRLVLVRASDSA